MSQKTLTINGKRYTGKKVSKLMNVDNMTNGEDYIVRLAGRIYFANYRQIQDSFWAPVCDKSNANAIALMPDDGLYTWSIWLTL